MNTLTERASYLLELAGNSLTELARIAGVKPPSVSQWLNGHTKSLAIVPATRLAKHFDLNPMWISKGIGPMRVSPSSDTQTASTPAQSQAQLINLSEHPELKEVPRVKFKLSAGVSGYAVEPEEGNGKPIFFLEDWFKTNGYDPTKLFAVLVSGQSMETSLWDGDLVVINTADTKPHDGDVYAINYEGELVIKRMRRDFGQWLATSDNTDQRRYAPKRCSEDVKIIGRVVYKQSERI